MWPYELDLVRGNRRWTRTSETAANSQVVSARKRNLISKKKAKAQDRENPLKKGTSQRGESRNSNGPRRGKLRILTPQQNSFRRSVRTRKPRRLLRGFATLSSLDALRRTCCALRVSRFCRVTNRTWRRYR